ncbi:MAG: lactate utilization protein [Proteobacteria bacterium]|nr:lactate utilization protein [Pseudomonadota bacterium]MDA1021763.1 lactate utilization protein [Pseudomonadota bacterium]
MSNARGEILGAIRTALKRPEAYGAENISVQQRIQAHRANLIPARGRLGTKARVDLFIREAEQVQATVARVSAPAGVPREVARFLAKNNLPMRLKTVLETSGKVIPWSEQTLLSVEEGRADGSEEVCVSQAFAGVAESGTLVMLSGADSPTTLNFLPPTHIVVLGVADIAGDYEEIWDRLRREKTTEAGRFMPRTVNWITGPSRSADIEQTLLLGAHGPLRLHIVIVDGDA